MKIRKVVSGRLREVKDSILKKGRRFEREKQDIEDQKRKIAERERKLNQWEEKIRASEKGLKKRRSVRK